MKSNVWLLLAFLALVVAFVWVRRVETEPSTKAVDSAQAQSSVAVRPSPAPPPAAREALAIAGRVADRAGKPIVAAHVALRSSGGRVLAEKAVTTDADGRFTTAPVPPGRYAVLVWARNSSEDAASGGLLASNVEEDVEAGRDDVRLVLAPAARARGVVQDASGRAIERAHVIAKTARGGVPQSTTITGKDGAFELVLPIDEDCTLEVRPPQVAAAPRGSTPAPAPLVLEGVRGGAEGLVVRAP